MGFWYRLGIWSKTCWHTVRWITVWYENTFMKIHVNEYFKNRISRKNVKDSLIIIGGFFIFSVIIALLLPPRSESDSVGRGFFVNLVMIIPLAAAVFFIVLAFGNQGASWWSLRWQQHTSKDSIGAYCYSDSPNDTNHRYYQQHFEHYHQSVFTEKTMIALERSVDMANEQILSIDNGLIRQLEQAKVRSW